MLFFLLISPLVFSQTKTVSGTVSDESGMPLPGVNVIEKGTTKGTTTDFDGNYQIEIGDDTTLVFSFLGFSTQEFDVSGTENLDVTLTENLEALEQVVVVGYGTQQRSDITSSISSVDADDLENLPVTGVQEALQGRAAGVTVTSSNGLPGSGVSVRIRGIGTVNNNDPLYVVDGVPVGGMNYLSPSDIASIDILKDASASAIYGSRAANGVVLITTKKGKEGKTKISFDTYYGISKPWKDFEPANNDEYFYMVEQLYGQNSETYKDALVSYDKGYNTDWWKETTKSAGVNNYNLSLSGGTEKVHYLVSGSYLKQGGPIDPSGFERFSARINTDFQLSDKIKVGENLSISNEVRDNTIPDILGLIMQYDPLVPVIDPNKDPNDPYSKWGVSDLSFGSSAPARLSREIGKQKDLRIVGNVFGNYKIIPDLEFVTTLGFDIQRGTSYSFDPIYFSTISDLNRNASASAGSTDSNGWVWTNTLTYKKSIQEHDFTVLLGTQAEHTESRWVSGTKFGQPSNDDRFQFIDAGTYGDRIYGSSNEYSLSSYFGRINYDYADKYLISGSIRRDGSSNFSEGKRWGTFPAFSAGWVVSKEDFWNNLGLNWFSNLKIRGGWGQLGNQNIPGGAFTSFIAGGNNRRFVLGDGNIVQGYGISNTGNSQIQWETSEQSNIGAEFGFFDRAFTMEVEFYDKKTKDMLIAYPVAKTFGVTSPWVNAGSVQNRGIELTLNYRGNIGDLDYSLGGNFSHYKNEVTSLGAGQPYIESMPVGSNPGGIGGNSRTAVGRPIGEFYGYRTAGIFQSQQEVNSYTNADGTLIQPNARPGDFRFADIDGDGQIGSNDATNIGSPHPDFTYGINLELNYKNFDFTLFLQGSQGNDIYNLSRYRTHHPTGEYNVAAGVVYNSWTPENGSNTLPILSLNDPNNNYRSSDWYVEDGSYMRFKNVQLGYSLPQSILGPMNIDQVRIYIAAQNLFTITNYSGLDPELGSYSPFLRDAGQRQRLMGVDSFAFPQSRTFQVGVSLKL